MWAAPRPQAHAFQSDLDAAYASMRLDPSPSSDPYERSGDTFSLSMARRMAPAPYSYTQQAALTHRPRADSSYTASLKPHHNPSPTRSLNSSYSSADLGPSFGGLSYNAASQYGGSPPSTAPRYETTAGASYATASAYSTPTRSPYDAQRGLTPDSSAQSYLSAGQRSSSPTPSLAAQYGVNYGGYQGISSPSAAAAAAPAPTSWGTPPLGRTLSQPVLSGRVGSSTPFSVPGTGRNNASSSDAAASTRVKRSIEQLLGLERFMDDAPATLRKRAASGASPSSLCDSWRTTSRELSDLACWDSGKSESASIARQQQQQQQQQQQKSSYGYSSVAATSGQACSSDATLHDNVRAAAALEAVVMTLISKMGLQSFLQDQVERHLPSLRANINTVALCNLATASPGSKVAMKVMFPGDLGGGGGGGGGVSRLDACDSEEGKKALATRMFTTVFMAKRSLKAALLAFPGMNSNMDVQQVVDFIDSSDVLAPSTVIDSMPAPLRTQAPPSSRPQAGSHRVGAQPPAAVPAFRTPGDEKQKQQQQQYDLSGSGSGSSSAYSSYLGRPIVSGTKGPPASLDPAQFSYRQSGLAGPARSGGLSSAKPTLVLDMDETLIHTVFNPGGSHTVLHRPGLFRFLDTVRPLYGRIVIFTASMADYADAVLDSLDPTGKYFDTRLYRESCTILNRGGLGGGAVYAKDLSKVVGAVGLERCVILDNIADNFCLQPSHGIAIKDFTGDPNDSALLTLAPLLVRFADNPEQQASQFFPRAMSSVRAACQ